MFEQETTAIAAPVQVVTAEQLATMTPDQLGEYIKGLQDAAKQAQNRISEAKARQSSESREALEKTLREQLGPKFPVLGEKVRASVKDAGFVGFSVIYSLEDGTGNISLVLPSRSVRKTASGDSDKAASTTTQRPLGEDYAANTTPEERAEDDAWIEARAKEGVAAGKYGGDIVRARGSAQWNARSRRLHKKGIAGY